MLGSNGTTTRFLEVTAKDGKKIRVPGLGMDFDRLGSNLPTKPGYGVTAHRGSHPGFSAAVGKRLEDIANSREEAIKAAVGKLVDPDLIADEIIKANKIAEDAIMSLNDKIQDGFMKGIPLHKADAPAGLRNQIKIHEMWMKALR